MNSQLILNFNNTEGVIITPPSSNGFHILWEVIDETSLLPVPAAGVAITTFIQLPHGTMIPFDVNPVSGDLYQIEPTTCAGGVTILIAASGIVTGMAVKIYMFGLF